MKKTPYALTYAPNFKWARLTVPNSSGQAWIKVLGKDDETGAKAALVKYDRGFTMEKGVSEVFSDCIVIEGEMSLGDKLLKKRGYYYRPAGAERGRIEALEDTTRFVITGGRGEAASNEPVFIDNVEGNSPEWETSERSTSWNEKTLRVDKKANCLITYQLANHYTVFLPGRKWVHPAVEEAYCIEGTGWDYVGEAETMVKLLPGTYIYRPPNETFHGNATTIDVPRRIFVKYYDANFDEKFRRSIEQDIVPASINE